MEKRESIRIITPEAGLYRLLGYLGSDENKAEGERRAYETSSVTYNKGWQLYQVWLDNFGATDEQRTHMQGLASELNQDGKEVMDERERLYEELKICP